MSFPARFSGFCAGRCGLDIDMGDMIVLYAGWYVHEGCEPMDDGLELKKNEEVCTECWLVKPCGC